MKRIRKVCLGSVLALLVLSLAAWSQESLGDAARRARMQKPASAPDAHVYTNENLPTTGHIGVTGTASTPSVEATGTEATGQSGTKSAADANAPKKDANATPSAEDQQKANDDWKGKIDAQKDEISRLERELNVLQREAQIKAAVYYADAGSQLRDPKKYADGVRKNQEDTDTKQKALNDAKQKLEDMQEEARKAGVPASSRD